GRQKVLVDADGVALREGDRDLPTVHAKDMDPIAEGGHVELATVRLAQTYGADLDQLGLDGGQIQYSPNDGVTIEAPQYRVLLGPPSQIEAKIAAYQTIRSYLESSKTPAQIVDVRSLDRPYFR